MTEIRLTNTKTRRKEVFTPIDPKNVRMYVCGPTVYDRAHIGNARPAIVFDVLNRLLRHVYGADHVTYVRNITDVEDKIIARAAENGEAIDALTARTEAWYLDDMAALGVLPPDHAPHATDYIPQMVAMIAELIARGHAYAAEGHVLFAVDSYADYGRLSGRSVDDMIAGARVEIAPYKKNPMDFVLWKPAAGDEPGWPSPWGKGRPGWHIECSAMAQALLGETFDIHGGGNDLMFPHHENEIAQSCCAHPGGDFARVWLHNEMLQVEGKKMSKSLGNFFTVRDLLDKGVPGEVIRFVFLSTHYRKPMDWTEEKAREAERTLDHWTTFLSVDHEVLDADIGGIAPDVGVIEALSDDLNTSLALTRLRQLGRRVDNSPEYLSLSDEEQFSERARFLATVEFLGLPLRERARAKRSEPRAASLERMELALAYKRAAAMESKDFSQVDRLKSALVEAGVEVRMTKDSIELVPGPDFDPAKLEALK